MRVQSQVVPCGWRRHARSGLALAVLALAAACSTTSVASETRSLPPCAITLAIDDFASVPAAPTADGAMYMTANGDELQRLLTASLGKVRAASRIVRLSELGDPAEADVVLKPRLKGPVEFSYEGWSSRWWASGGLWLVTWIGGMAVDDATYKSNMVVDCELRFQRSGNPMLRTATSTPVDVAFLERNDFFSWPTVQSLILPPFLTSDQPDSTRQALTDASVDAVAIELARYLKRDFELDAQKIDHCMIRLDSPVNGATVVSDSVELVGTITPDASVAAVQVRVGDGEPIRADIVPMNPPDPDHPNRCRFRCIANGLGSGDNYIRLVVVAGDEYSRTLLVTRK